MSQRRQGWSTRGVNGRALVGPLRSWWTAYTAQMLGAIPADLASLDVSSLTGDQLDRLIAAILSVERGDTPGLDIWMRGGTPAARKAAALTIRELQRRGMPDEVGARLRPPPPTPPPMGGAPPPPPSVGIAFGGVQLLGTFELRTLEGWAARGAGLIRSIPRDLLSDLPTQVALAAARGDRSTTLRALIQGRLGASESRVQLIARDQLAKLNSEVTESLHEAAGVTGYTWRANGDERTRPTHLAASGQFFTWASGGAPGTGPYGERTHPGRGIQCRCTPEPAVPDAWAQRPQRGPGQRRFTAGSGRPRRAT